MAVDFTRTRPNETRKPEFVELPDGRKRLTRYFDLADGDRITDSLVEAYGTADLGDVSGAPTVGFAGLRLINQSLQKTETKQGNQSVYVKVYEELHATNENAIGNPTTIKLEDGRTALEVETWQFVGGSFTAGTVGATTYSGDASAFLLKVEAPDDGTLRKIKRTYVHAGTLSTDDQTLQGGALLKKTIVSAKTVPSTPAGFTLVGAPVQNPSGLPVYTYTYYKGDGEVSRNFTNNQGGAVDFNPAAPTSSVGPVRCTIVYLTATSVTTDPTTRPTSFKRVKVDHTDLDGYRLWTVEFGYGTGVIVHAAETKEGGKLVIYRLTSIDANAPSPPGQTIGGTVTQISYSYREDDGYRVWDSVFAEGFGEAGRSTRYGQSSAGDGSVGSTTIIITHLTATGASDPTSAPSGCVKVGSVPSAQDGYLVWTVTYAKGAGLVITSDRKSNNGKLVVYSRTALGAAPSAPAATISGTVVSTLTGYREAEGYKIYDYEWAEGVGTIANEQSTHHNGKLIIYRKRALGTAPSAPSATIGGTVTLTDDDSRDDSGVAIYDRTWAEGFGVISKQSPRDLGEGLRMETWISLGATYDAAFMLPAGILRFKDYEELDGTVRWTVSCIQNAAGASPLVGTTVASIDIVSTGNFDYGSVPTITISGGGGSGATATVTLSNGTTGFVTAITLTAAGSGFTSPPQVTISGGTSDVPTFAANLTGVAVLNDRIVKFRYPGRAQAVSLAHPDVSGSANLEIQLSPFIDTEILGSVEISYRTSSDLSDLANPWWAPSEWATVFAQYISPNGYPVSRVEGLRDYRTVGGVSAISQSYGAISLVSVMGNETGYISGKKAYLKVFGGPDAPDNKTFTLDAECDLAFVGYDGTKYYRRTVVFATIPPQAAMPTLTSVVVISTAVTSLATLRAVTTVGAVLGGRTNAFTYAFTQGGVLFIRQMRGTLTDGVLANETLFQIKPTDYNASTNHVYWLLS